MPKYKVFVTTLITIDDEIEAASEKEAEDHGYQLAENPGRVVNVDVTVKEIAETNKNAAE